MDRRTRSKSVILDKQNQAIENIKRKRSQAVSEEPPKKKQKLGDICADIEHTEVELLPETEIEKDKIKIIKNRYVGKFLFDITKTTPGWEKYSVRKIDKNYVNNLKNEILNNALGSLFRQNFVINIFDKPKCDIKNFNLEEQADYCSELKGISLIDAVQFRCLRKLFFI